MPDIDAATLLDRLEDDDLLLVDVRPREVYEEWHLPGSRNVPVYDDLKTEPSAAIETLEELPRDRDIVFVCNTGNTSGIAAAGLAYHGYDASSLEGGMMGWSTVHLPATVSTDIEGHILQIVRPGPGCLSYVIVSEDEAAIVDPSIHISVYEDLIDDAGATVVGIFETHAHADHVSGGSRLSERFEVPCYCHPADMAASELTAIADGGDVRVGSVRLTTVHTPGHTPGSVCLDLDGEALFTGDTLLLHGVGRVVPPSERDATDRSPQTAVEELFRSVRRLMEREGDPLVLPGHTGAVRAPPIAARLAAVRRDNPLVTRDPDAFTEQLLEEAVDRSEQIDRIRRLHRGTDPVDSEEIARLESGPNPWILE